MSSMTDRVFLLVSLHQGSLLGVHGHTSGQTGDIWVLLRNEAALYQLISGLAEFTSRGMWCTCAEIDDLARCCEDVFNGRHSPGKTGFQPVADSPAPEWRRPTLDEMIQIIEGRTPPAIVKWCRFEAWGEK